MKKRRNTDKYLCHDELLFQLFNLEKSTIKHEIINGIHYLTNVIKCKKHEIGFRVKLENGDIYDWLTDGEEFTNMEYGDIYISFDEDDWINKEHEVEKSLLIEKYSKYLCLSNDEKYIYNVLLEKYLSEGYIFELSLREIEFRYRKNMNKVKKTQLNVKTYNRYLKILDSLSKKEVVIKTTNSFRKPKYGVNDKNYHGPLVRFISTYQSDINNVTFQYDLGMLGTILKDSKRYSTILGDGAFNYKFNQIRYHLVCCYFARKLFIENKYSNYKITNKKDSSFIVDIDEITGEIIDYSENIQLNKLRFKKNLIKHIFGILDYLKSKEYIQEYKVKYTYDETEKFEKLHEFDYDIHFNLEYEFGLDDLRTNGDVQMEIEVIVDKFNVQIW